MKAEANAKRLDDKDALPIAQQAVALAEKAVTRAQKAQRAIFIKTMNAEGLRLKWDPESQARLSAALNKLSSDGDPDATFSQAWQTWKTILARGSDDALAKDAGGADGPGFPGAGTQTANDCAVFALANAAGQLYGAVAASATDLIRHADWRDAAHRANPEKAIEETGLTGGELIILAEAYGQAEVLPMSDFAKTLKDGRPVMVNVVPDGGTGGHQVVLTKTFQHDGETWFVMMDSNQGPLRRLYLSAKELGTLLQEKGIAFRPEPGRTPKLLR
jgi:hypothetical protein